jgi:hypothetical protein
LTLLLGLAGAPTGGWGAERPPEQPQVTGKAMSLGAAHYWYDGQRKRQIWLNPRLQAHFYPTPEALLDIPSRAAQADAQVLLETPFIRIVEIPLDAPGTRSEVQSQDLSSAVFHDTPSAHGALRALPGGIIIYLSPDWDEHRATAWLESQGLRRIARLPVNGHVVLVESAPGLAALEQANALYEAGEVLAAFPDWWRHAQPK